MLLDIQMRRYCLLKLHHAEDEVIVTIIDESRNKKDVSDIGRA